MSSVVRVGSILMAGLFFFAAALQYNDPDPIRWATIYLLAVVACVLYFVGRLTWYVPAVIGLVALVWAGVIAPDVWGRVTFSQMFETWIMTNPLAEEARELCGLLIVAFWMAVLVIVPVKDRSSL